MTFSTLVVLILGVGLVVGGASDKNEQSSTPMFYSKLPGEEVEATCSVCVANRDYCDPNWLPQPNLLSAFYGVDIAKKVPLPFKVPDESTRGLIFNAVYRNGTMGNMEMYNFYSTRNDLVCNAKFEATAYESLEDYIEGSSSSTMKSWDLGYKGPKVEAKLGALTITPPPNSASVGNSNQESNSDYHRFFEQERGSISRSSAKCSVYIVDVDIDSKSLSLHENFENAIRSIDSAVGEEKDEKMKAFIQKFGTHYASQSVMGIGTIFETRFTESESYRHDQSVRNQCSTTSGGFRLFGFGYSKSHTKCKGSMRDTTRGKKTSLERFRSTSYGTLPSGSKSLEQWSSMVQKMMETKTLTPLPTNQVLRPIMDILLTEAVANIKHKNGSRIDHKSLLTTALNGYVAYLPSFQTGDYQFSCANKVRIGHSTYTAQKQVLNGKTIYKDDYSKNYLIFDKLWKVAPSYSSPGVLTSAPCPWRSVGFSGPTYFQPPLPNIKNWKVCASKCYASQPSCKFWQHDSKSKLCSHLTDFKFMAKNSSTNSFTVGSVDCPGKQFKYASGLCPENNPSRSMLKHKDEMDKHLSIEGFDPNSVLLVGGVNTNHVNSKIASGEVIKKGGKCYIPHLRHGGVFAQTLILTPGDNKVLHCGGQQAPYKHLCLELDIQNGAWKQHSTLPGNADSAKSVTLENGVYLFTESGSVFFLPRMSRSWQIIYKPTINFWSYCVVKTSETGFHLIGQTSYKYDTLTNSWTKLKSLGLFYRECFSCAMIDNKVIVAGGRIGSTYISTTQVIPFKNGNVAGTPRYVGNLNLSRGFHGMVVVGGKYPRVMVFGGWRGKYTTGSIEVWQPDQEKWKMAPYYTATARFRFGILALPDSLVCQK